eukprot:gene133-355_t
MGDGGRVRRRRTRSRSRRRDTSRRYERRDRDRVRKDRHFGRRSRSPPRRDRHFGRRRTRSRSRRRAVTPVRRSSNDSTRRSRYNRRSATKFLRRRRRHRSTTKNSTKDTNSIFNDSVSQSSSSSVDMHIDSVTESEASSIGQKQPCSSDGQKQLGNTESSAWTYQQPVVENEITPEDEYAAQVEEDLKSDSDDTVVLGKLEDPVTQDVTSLQPTNNVPEEKVVVKEETAQSPGEVVEDECVWGSYLGGIGNYDILESAPPSPVVKESTMTPEKVEELVQLVEENVKTPSSRQENVFARPSLPQENVSMRPSLLARDDDQVSISSKSMTSKSVTSKSVSNGSRVGEFNFVCVAPSRKPARSRNRNAFLQSDSVQPPPPKNSIWFPQGYDNVVKNKVEKNVPPPNVRDMKLPPQKVIHITPQQKVIAPPSVRDMKMANSNPIPPPPPPPVRDMPMTTTPTASCLIQPAAPPPTNDTVAVKQEQLPRCPLPLPLPSREEFELLSPPADKKSKKSSSSSSKTPVKYGCDVSVASSQLEQAVGALQKYADLKAKEANMLFDGDSMPVMLLFALNGPPKHQKRVPHLVKLPHPLWNDESEVCLITSDPQRKFKDMLEAEPVPAVKKIIGYDKVKKRYNTHVYKRQLARDFELFLCDDKIYSSMPSLTGQKVMKTKPPIPVVLKKGDVQKNINKVLKSAHVRIPNGSCVSVRFAKANFTLEQIMSNAEAVLKKTLDFLQKNGLEVNTVNIQVQDCPALPIFTRKIAEDVKLTPQKLKKERQAEKQAQMSEKQKAREEKKNKKALKRKRKEMDDADVGVDLELQPDDLVEKEIQKPVKKLKKMKVAETKKTKEEQIASAKISKKKGKKASKVAEEPTKKKKKGGKHFQYDPEEVQALLSRVLTAQRAPAVMPYNSPSTSVSRSPSPSPAEKHHDALKMKLIEEQDLSDWKKNSQIRVEHLSAKWENTNVIDAFFQFGRVTGFRRKGSNAIVEFSQEVHAKQCKREMNGLLIKHRAQGIKWVKLEDMDSFYKSMMLDDFPALPDRSRSESLIRKGTDADDESDSPTTEVRKPKPKKGGKKKKNNTSSDAKDTTDKTSTSTTTDKSSSEKGSGKGKKEKKKKAANPNKGKKEKSKGSNSSKGKNEKSTSGRRKPARSKKQVDDVEGKKEKKSAASKSSKFRRYVEIQNFVTTSNTKVS